MNNKDIKDIENICDQVIDEIKGDRMEKCKNCKKSTPVYNMYKRLQGYYCKDPLFKDSFFELPKNYGCNRFKIKGV